MTKFKTINLHELSRGINNNCRSILPRCNNKKQSRKYTATYKKATTSKGGFNKVVKQFY